MNTQLVITQLVNTQLVNTQLVNTQLVNTDNRLLSVKPLVTQLLLCYSPAPSSNAGSALRLLLIAVASCSPSRLSAASTLLYIG